MYMHIYGLCPFGLVGERSGKSPKGMAVYKSGISQILGSATATCSEIDRAKNVSQFGNLFACTSNIYNDFTEC